MALLRKGCEDLNYPPGGEDAKRHMQPQQGGWAWDGTQPATTASRSPGLSDILQMYPSRM